jgi:hypothetical protein
MGLGLKELIRRSKPDECPFCGEPRILKPRSRTILQLTCGDAICRAACCFYWWRDERERLRKKREEQAIYASQPAAKNLQAARSKAWKVRNPEKFNAQKLKYHQSEKGKAMRARANKKYYDKKRQK